MAVHLRFRATLGLLTLAGALAVGRAHAQDPGEVPSTATVTSPTGLGIGGRRPYWGGGRSRPFIAATLEAGFLYYRPKLALGWGKPHWRWFGVEAQSLVSVGSFSEYAGVRAALPFADFTLGGRYVFSSRQSYLERGETYTDDELEFEEEPNARYLAIDAELAGAAPVWNDGSVVATLSGSYIVGVPDDYDVYERSLNVVVEPPWVLRQRLGYQHAFGDDDGLQFGFSAETIQVPERGALIVRFGPQMGVAITHHLDAALSVMVPLYSPDDLRLEGTEIGQFGFRYRWATGDPFPEFP